MSAFGLGLLTHATPPGAWEARPLTEPILHLRSATTRAVAESWSGLEAIGWEGVIDGAPFVVERGRAGDHRFVHGADPDQRQSGARSDDSDGTRAVHHLSPDVSLLQCAPSDSAEQSWWRVVLDSVLFTAALLQGYEALHAGALATPAGVIAITATTGGGKSTLLTELLRHGLTLMADDVLVLEPSDTDAPPLAHPAPPLMTIPAARLPLLGQASSATRTGSVRTGPPETISSLGEERWIAVPVHPAPLPLAALVVLNRSPGLATGLHSVERPLPALMDSLLRFPRTRARERARFELAGAIAAHVPIWELDADSSVAPDTLAGLLLAELM
ncbi:MAG TPA: hypothetical protein VNY31_05770 [Solirubrobacteraceae bacterium]|nr:hypothetical protein [Solirubrobacteraceae bacterium]